MAIKHWHWGKIAMIWASVPLLMWFLNGFGQGFIGPIRPGGNAPGKSILILMFSGLIFTVPVAAFVITWKWMSGKDKNT